MDVRTAGLRSLRAGTLALVIAMAFSPMSTGAATTDFTAKEAPANTIWLDSLDLKAVNQQFGVARAGRSVAGNPIRIKGTTYEHGLGTHACSEMEIDLFGAAKEFSAMAGVDDEVAGGGSVSFEVYVDNKKVADTGVLKGSDGGRPISVDLRGAKHLTLIVGDGNNGIDYDHADWAGAMIVLAPGAKSQPKSATAEASKPANIASGVSPKPAIHGALIVGTTPRRPFIFLIPATGQGPLTYSAKNLPAGLELDSRTGVITGSIGRPGSFTVDLSVTNKHGAATRRLTIVGGDHKLALTPPMGWNSWNCWAGAVDDAKVRAAADAMVNSGLAAHGYQYINIDDCWEGERNASGEIQTNKKFPDMKALADYVHSKGLKLGIYSSPGPKTCAGFEASYQHEEQDAKTYAKWGIDYLKYDWCSYGNIARNDSIGELQKPYLVMQKALDNCGRDIVYSLCQYGMGNVWEWGEKVGGNCWRTTGDIGDSWSSMSGIGFSQDGHEKFAGPGHWNDPDMLVVGKVGWGPSLHPTTLTQNEQITHITLWSILSSPLLIGCDMSQLVKFTTDLLTNDDVIAVNQDPLGKPAGRKAQEGLTQVWARPLWDGTVAVGLFNRGQMPAKVTARWADLKIVGKQPVRDLWQKKDLGSSRGSFSSTVPGHGAVLVKIGEPRNTD
jgi:alpha-galactosidase